MEHVKPWVFETLGSGNLQSRKGYVERLLGRIANVCDMNKAITTDECVYHTQHLPRMGPGKQHYAVSIVYGNQPRTVYLHKIMRYLFEENFVLATNIGDADAFKYCACHKCVNEGRCINPTHIFIGSYRDNNKDVRGEGNGCSILLSQDVHLIASLKAKGKTPTQIHQAHPHLNINTIKNIWSGRQWSWLTGITWTKQNQFYDPEEQKAIIRQLRTENPTWGGRRIRAHPSVKMPLSTIHKYLREVRTCETIDCVKMKQNKIKENG